jgi:small neutral amino acid transporter SnatA (MarC family)
VSEFWREVLGLFASVAPFGALPVFAAHAGRAGGGRRAILAIVVGLIAFALLAAAIAVGDPFLAWIDVSPENFQLAAGLAMMPLAFRLIWAGDSMGIRPNQTSGVVGSPWLVPLAVPLVAGPASLAAAISYGTRFGVGSTLGAAALTIVLTTATFAASGLLVRLVGSAGISALGRLSGLLLVVIIVELMVDGVQSV